MSIAIATRGIIAGIGAAGTGDPYPVDIDNPLVDPDHYEPALTASYNDEVDPSEALPPWDYVEYIPNKRSTEEILPANSRVSFPLPGNLD